MQCPHCGEIISWISTPLDQPSLMEGNCSHCLGKVALTFSFLGMVLMFLVTAIVVSTLWGKVNVSMLLIASCLGIGYGSIGLEKRN